jgi:hypothetical protein
MKLRQLNLVSLIFTQSGKEYLTPQQLKLEISQELRDAGRSLACLACLSLYLVFAFVFVSCLCLFVLSSYLSLCLYLSLSFSFMYLSFSLCLFVYLPLCLFVFVFVFPVPFVSLSPYLYVSVFSFVFSFVLSLCLFLLSLFLVFSCICGCKISVLNNLSGGRISLNELEEVINVDYGQIKVFARSSCPLFVFCFLPSFFFAWYVFQLSCLCGYPGLAWLGLV